MEDLGNRTKPLHQENPYLYRPEIDGIRAFAVMAVIINHFNKDLLPSGYLGVDIFFVISGFVITSSLAARPSKNFSDFILGFYTRRIKRLVPALVMSVLISSLLICLFNPNPDASLETGMASLFGLSNLYLMRQSTDYFAPSTELNVFTHTWSLGVEEQFYFLFPLLVWFTGFGRLAVTEARKRVPTFGTYANVWSQKPGQMVYLEREDLSKVDASTRNLIWVMGTLSVMSLIAFVYIYKTRQPAAYFSMPTRLWEFGAGCLLLLFQKQSNRYLRVLERLSPLMVFIAIVAVLFVPFKFAVQATVGIAILSVALIACLRPGTVGYEMFVHPQVVYVGLISYSLYLWHWSVLSLSRWTIGIHWWSVPFQFALMLLISIVSYRYVETPLRRADSSATWRQSIGLGLAASTCIAVVLFALAKIPNLSLYTGRSPSMAAVGVASLNNPYFLQQTNSLWKGNECILSDNSQVGKKISIENCTLGNFSDAKKRVMVFGNSFSAAFIQAFDDIVVSDGYSVTLTSTWGGSVIKEIPYTGRWNQANNYYWNRVFPSLVNRLRPGDWVFLISDMAEFSPKNRTSETNESLEKLKSGLESLSGKLSVKGIQLAILHGNPFAREANCPPAIAAKQWFSPFGGHCQLPNRTESLLRRDRLNTVLISLEAEKRLHTVDVFDVFCPEEQCTYMAKNGQILYRDEASHPSVEGVRLSSPIIRKMLTSS
jgi:peptidoglycan/LPS O-acetylase OafA/YrhL